MSDFAKDTNVPANDCISRQAVIDAIEDDNRNGHYSCFASNSDAQKFKQVVNELPSAQPEIIRCKDCKHWCIHKRLDIPWCRNLHIDRGADDFCSYAERRADE